MDLAQWLQLPHLLAVVAEEMLASSWRGLEPKTSCTSQPLTQDWFLLLIADVFFLVMQTFFLEGSAAPLSSTGGAFLI